MPAEHLFSLARRLCGTDQRAEALENSFELSILRALYRSRLGVPARLDRGRKRELCEDVTFQPLPAAFVHAPFGSVLAQVQGAMCVMGVPLLPIDGLPEPDEESALFLQDVVSSPEPVARGAITTRNERFVSTAARNHRRYWASGRQIAGAGAAWSISGIPGSAGHHFQASLQCALVGSISGCLPGVDCLPRREGCQAVTFGLSGGGAKPCSVCPGRP
jgi:hypothetical protein